MCCGRVFLAVFVTGSWVVDFTRRKFPPLKYFVSATLSASVPGTSGFVGSAAFVDGLQEGNGVECPLDFRQGIEGACLKTLVSLLPLRSFFVVWRRSAAGGWSSASSVSPPLV